MARGLWGRENDGGNVLEAARTRVAKMFDDFDYVVVSFSGGKDSTAVLNLCLDEAKKRNALPLQVIFFDEEAIAPDTEDYVRRVAQLPEVDLKWFCVPLRHRNGAAQEDGYWFPWAEEDRDKWVRPLPPEAITEIPGLDMSNLDHRAGIADFVPYILDPKKGRAAVALGIRAAESMTRLKAVVARNRENAWVIPADDRTPWFTKCYPVYDWTTQDIWTAPAQLGWDYNHFYDVLEMAGVSHHGQRCAPPYGDEPLRGLHLWQETYPELWDKMVERVPGAAAAARYANTELYGAYEPLTLAEGQTPQEHIREIINQHASDEMRNAAADAVRKMIKRHYRKTAEPISLNVKHPDTGLAWRTLAKAARTADLKGRIRSGITVSTNRKADRRRYIEELYELRERGATWLPAKLPNPEETDNA